MSDVRVSTENWPMAFVFWWVMVQGDPDLLDALIHFLMAAK